MQKKRGISLIVLVITIIVMIILAAAIIISLNNSGIIKRASEAVKEYNEDEVNHVASLAWSEAYINGARTVEALTAGVRTGLSNAGLNPDDYGIIVTTSGVKVTKRWLQDGIVVTKGNVTLEVGDLIQYNAGVTGYHGKWKVLGAEDGKLLIMATEDIGTLELYSFKGGTRSGKTYNYGLLDGSSKLNEMCSPYGHGIGAEGARSINGEDVNKLTGYDPTTHLVGSINQYGNKVTYSWTSGSKVNYTSTNGSSGTCVNVHSSGFTYIDFSTMTKTTVNVNANGMPTLTCSAYGYNIYNTTETPFAPKYQKAIETIIGEGTTHTGNYEYYDENDEVYYVPYSYTSYSDKYWLDSYFINTFTLRAAFGLLTISQGNLTAKELLGSASLYSAGELGVRAVVELSPNIIIGTKDDTAGWSYTI